MLVRAPGRNEVHQCANDGCVFRGSDVTPLSDAREKGFCRVFHVVEARLQPLKYAGDLVCLPCMERSAVEVFAVDRLADAVRDAVMLTAESNQKRMLIMPGPL